MHESHHDRPRQTYPPRAAFAMRIQANFEALMKTGAILTMPHDGYRVVLANIHYNGYMLWFYEAFGREHLLQVDGMQPSGPWRQMLRGETIVATIGPMEGDDDSKIWHAWNEFLQTTEGLHVAASIAEMKSQAAGARE